MPRFAALLCMFVQRNRRVVLVLPNLQVEEEEMANDESKQLPPNRILRIESLSKSKKRPQLHVCSCCSLPPASTRKVF